jgi:hypothetical protein
MYQKRQRGGGEGRGQAPQKLHTKNNIGEVASVTK